MKLGYGFGAFGNRLTATPELHFGLSDAVRDLPPLEGRGPCLGQTHRRVVPDAIVGAPAPDREPLDPHLRALRRAAQIQPVLVEEPLQALGRRDLPYRELAQSRTTIRTPVYASSPDSGWLLKERPETDKLSFINLLRALDEAGRCLKRVSGGGGGGNRTRVRKRSTFGSTCLAASFHLTASPPDGQGCETASLRDLTASSEAVEAASPCESTSGIRTHGHVTVEGWLPLRRPERSCRRWQLMCCSRIYEEAASSACTSGFITHVEAVSPPLRGDGIVRPGPSGRQCRGGCEPSLGPTWTIGNRPAPASAPRPRRR